jgi:putative DNA primase/helicase
VCDFEPAPLPDGLLEYIEMKAAEAGMASPGTRAGAGLVTTPSHANNDELGENTLPGGRTPPAVEAMRAALHHLADRNYFEDRGGVVRDANDRIVKIGWIETGMALKPAYGKKVGFDLWSVTHIDDQARADAPAQWASFAAEAQPGHVTIGTIIKAAKDAGFAHMLSAQPVSACPPGAPVTFTGNGVDVENGKLFASEFRNRLLYVHETGEWLWFSTQQGWVSAQPGEADRSAKEVLAMLRLEAGDRYKTAGSDDPILKRMTAHVRYTSKAQNLRAMIEMAKSEPGMTVRLSDFDDDPTLLGVTNGVLDLPAGTLLPVSPGVLVSKRCNIAFDPAANCPRFERFLREVQPDGDVRAFLQRFMGYCLSGSVSEQVFAFFYGHGANGKSVFIELFAWLLRDYARKIATDMLMHHQRNPQGPSPDIVSLKGLRLAFANETEEGRRLAEARIKDMTGGDTLSGRMPYGKADITFAPTHKLIIVGNHKPEITDNSHGMWRRVLLTPFQQTIPEAERDPRLLEALKREGSGVLNWMLAGLREYQRNGLQVPDKIKGATAAYRDEQDVIGEWVAERCKSGPGCSEKKGVLYTNYQDWAITNGHKPMAQGRLTRRLNEREGYDLSKDRRVILGLSLASGNLGGVQTL